MRILSKCSAYNLVNICLPHSSLSMCVPMYNAEVSFSFQSIMMGNEAIDFDRLHLLKLEAP